MADSVELALVCMGREFRKIVALSPIGPLSTSLLRGVDQRLERLRFAPRVAADQSVEFSVSPSASTMRSISAGVLMKGGASWMVSPP